MDSESLINAHERKLKEVNAKASLQARNEIQDFSSSYLQRVLCSIDDDQVRQLACDMVTDSMPQLSRIHTKYATILEDRDRLHILVPERIYNWKNALLLLKINQLKAEIARADASQQPQLMQELQRLYNIRHEMAACIGDRVVNPK